MEVGEEEDYKMGSDETHFNVSVGSDGQSHKTVSINHNLFEEKGEPKRYRTEVLPLTSLTLYRWAKPAHNTTRLTAFLFYLCCCRWPVPASAGRHHVGQRAVPGSAGWPCCPACWVAVILLLAVLVRNAPPPHPPTSWHLGPRQQPSGLSA